VLYALRDMGSCCVLKLQWSSRKARADMPEAH